METVSYIILVPMVYLAVAIFVIGTTVRLVKIFKEPKHPVSLQIFPLKRPSWLWALADTLLFPTVRRHKPVLWFFLMLFHGCLLLLIVGHLELLGDFAILQIVPHEIFLGKGLVGLLTGIALFYFLFRRFRSPVRELSIPEDYYLLILLFLVVLFGSQMDWARNWYYYDSMGVEDYREYLGSLINLDPILSDTITESGHSFMLVLHVFFANLFLIFFPFSQAMHSFLSLPMNKLRKG